MTNPANQLAEALEALLFFPHRKGTIDAAKKALAAYRENPGGWIDPSKFLPENGKCVFVYFTNRNGITLTARAHYIRRFTVEAGCDEDSENWDFFEYLSEDDDTGYYPEGWYEENHFEECMHFIHHKIEGWQPTPKPPEQSDG